MAENVSDILGRWRMIEIEGSDPNDGEIEVQPFIQFDRDGSGEFAFGCVQGFVDHRVQERDGKPGIEWTWHGNDEMDEVSGRGWAVLYGDPPKISASGSSLSMSSPMNRGNRAAARLQRSTGG
jgi:hypothetical protein